MPNCYLFESIFEPLHQKDGTGKQKAFCRQLIFES